jgi:hypothetical protein
MRASQPVNKRGSFVLKTDHSTRADGGSSCMSRLLYFQASSNNNNNNNNNNKHDCSK